ncbi:MAG: riboflavin synthase [Lysobacterales bacterium CG02_land_8_20_14_3_00_62_12]|nr:MAG: riboflavin synthase [Xanthomonadales bacterium CG02_land_8_20_14_3_00_62_12]
MFTGLIQAIGKVRSIDASAGDRRLLIDSPTLATNAPKIGDSIAVSGVCLTVAAHTADGFALDVSMATLDCTTLASWRVGRRVNLERSLRLGDPLDGHLVSGHVDGVGGVQRIAAEARSQRWRVAMPPALARYVAVKGSIAVDGVSLTVNAVGSDWFEVNLIAHTLAHTTFAFTAVGEAVNLEIDLLARYAERLLQGSAPSSAVGGSSEGADR